MTYASQQLRAAVKRATRRSNAALVEAHYAEYRALFLAAMAEEGYDRRVETVDNFYLSTGLHPLLSPGPEVHTDGAAPTEAGADRATSPTKER